MTIALPHRAEEGHRPYYNPVPKPKYTQNWSAYNKAQTKEKFIFLRILSDSVDSINIKTYGKRNGRPPMLMPDMIKACCIKVFNDFSARRNNSDIEISHLLKYLNNKPHFNSILKYMNSPYITPFLKELIKLTSLPLRDYEKNFAIDSTGFSTFCKDKWVSVRLDHQKHHNYKKLHAICGVNTNIIVAAKVTNGTASDCPHFQELLKEAAKHFNIRNITADAGYLSRKNVQCASDLNISPYIKLKKNTIPRAKGHYPAWNNMVWLFRKNENLFKAHYHKRSNVESTFAMIKKKFSPFLRSRKQISQENELLCKVVCHNISVLVSAIFKHNLELPF